MEVLKYQSVVKEIYSCRLPRGDAEEGHPRSEDKLARRNGETSAGGPRGVME